MARIFRKLAQLLDVDLTSTPPEDGDALVYDEGGAKWVPGAGGGGGGSDDQTAAEVPFTPAGTIAATDTQAAVEEVASDAATALSTHAADTTSVHGITDTSALALSANVPSNTTFNDHSARHEDGGADEISIQGLSGTPAALTTHEADTTNVHGIADTSALALTANHPSNATFNDHSARHEDGGADEISIAGLSGTSTALQAHLDDTADAHDASAISVADSGGNFTGSDVEAVLAELQDNIDGVGGGSTDGWIADSDTWTYASASTFTVSGDVTVRFSKGTRLKFTQTTAKYAVVVASSHAAGTTTVTIAVNTDYTLANAAITATYYSYDVNPQGYPAQFAYTPSWTSSGTQPAIVNGTITGSFSIVGNMCDVKVNISMGGSTTFGTGTYSISYPVTEVTGGVEANGMCLLFDSSVSGFYPAMWRAGSLMQLATVPSSFAANNAPFTWAASDQMQLSNRYRI